MANFLPFFEASIIGESSATLTKQNVCLLNNSLWNYIVWKRGELQSG